MLGIINIRQWELTKCFLIVYHVFPIYRRTHHVDAPPTMQFAFHNSINVPLGCRSGGGSSISRSSSISRQQQQQQQQQSGKHRLLLVLLLLLPLMQLPLLLPQLINTSKHYWNKWLINFLVKYATTSTEGEVAPGIIQWHPWWWWWWWQLRSRGQLPWINWLFICSIYVYICIYLCI